MHPTPTGGSRQYLAGLAPAHAPGGHWPPSTSGSQDTRQTASPLPAARGACLAWFPPSGTQQPPGAETWPLGAGSRVNRGPHPPPGPSLHHEAPGPPPSPAQPDRPPPHRPTAAIAPLGSHPGLDPRHQRAHTRCASPASGGGRGSESRVWPCSVVERAERKSPRSSQSVSWRGGQERAVGRGGGGGCPGAGGGWGTAAHAEPTQTHRGASPTTFAHSPTGITRAHTLTGTHTHSHT